MATFVNDVTPTSSLETTEKKAATNEVELGSTGSDQPQELKRQFKPRHVQMIAMASNIGTGLFIGTGTALRQGGPGALIISYMLITISLTTMMQCLCEMSVLLPVPGSFTRYATRFVDPALGFASGWLYWSCWIGAFGVEAVAANLCIQYWTDAVPVYAVILVFIAINVLIHVLPVRVFGEVEFFVSSLKVLVVFGVIIVCWVIMGGGSPSHTHNSSQNWSHPGAFLRGFQGLASTFVFAAFSCGGTEITGVVSGEAYRPRFTLPRGIKTFVFRMCFFYITALLFISFCVSPDDAALRAAGGGAGTSPFVIAVKNGGIKVIPHIINAVILIAVTSVASCSVYISSRVMQSMGEDGFAPKFLATIDHKGRPKWALVCSGIVAIGVAFVNCAGGRKGNKDIFLWLTSLSGITFFIIWGSIVFSAMRFRWALEKQGDPVLNGKYYYKNPWFPYNCYFALLSFLFMLICQLYAAVKPFQEEASGELTTGKFSTYKFFQAAMPIPVFFVLYGGWKLYSIIVHKQSFLVPLDAIDLQTGRIPDDINEEKFIDEYRQQTRFQRFVTYIPFVTDYAS